jgi:bifunctional non-homologous end joining protein LigD
MAKGKLSEYSAKRRFDTTPEPGPTPVQGREGPLLFVVQRHSARRLHYDFRLECDGVLKSWAVPKGLSADPAEKRLAVRTEDHPFDYASFEGVIPSGQYGAGEVIVWDCGVYSPDEDGHWFHDRAQAERRVREGLDRGKLSILLRGEKAKGSYALVRTKDGKSWLLLKHRDRFVRTGGSLAHGRSVLSGLSVEDLETRPVQRLPAERLVPGGTPRAAPADLEPMHASLAEKPFNDARWVWEPKLDGYRVLAFVDAGKVRLRSRNRLDLAADFPAVAAELGAQQVRSMILDGELVAFDASGKPSFAAIQNRAGTRGANAVFYCFDVLHFEGIDLRNCAYADRRRYLAQCLLPSAHVQLVHAENDGIALYEASLASGLEGVVGKRTDSVYEAGRRSGAWLKVKATTTDDFVVGGFTRGKGGRAALGALLVGRWDGKRLVFASHVGSGLDEESIALLRRALRGLERRVCPFSAEPEVNGPVVWVEPKTVVEVRFQGWTADRHLRAPVYLRVRDEIDPAGVRTQKRIRAPETPASPVDEVLQQLRGDRASMTLRIGEHAIRMTHLDRVYWPADAALRQPALTKRDLLRYLAEVSPFILPHLEDRPLTMIRMPDGIAGQRFFQKHWTQQRPPFVRGVTVFSGHKDVSHEYLLCNDLPTLLWLAQSGTLEFHVWHSRARSGRDAICSETDYASSLRALEHSVLNYPDYVVFDIDPYIYSGKEAPGAEPELNTVAFEKGKEIAFRLRALLREMSLDSIVKTSGKTGLHVFVPIRRTIDFEAARQVSELVGRHLMRRHPKDITLEWSVPKRTGKIFMDYNMNVRGKTLNVAYSPRGAAGAPVSMPLTWEELEKAHPLDFRVANVPALLRERGDRWREALTRKQSLEAALKPTGR